MQAYIDTTHFQFSSAISYQILSCKNGWILPASDTLRILMILAEVNYDVGTDPNGPPGDWPPGQLPPWINNLLDVNSPSIGRLTYPSDQVHVLS